MKEQLSDCLEKLCLNLPLLQPYFVRSGSLEENVKTLYRFIDATVPCDQVAVVHFNSLDLDAEMEFVSLDADGSALPEEKRRALAARLEPALRSAPLEEGLLQTPDGYEQVSELILPISYDGELLGGLVLWRAGRGWSEDETAAMKLFTQILGLNFSNRDHLKAQELYRFVFNTMMDHMQASLYVTDPKTDKILFMNQAMRDDFGIEHPEGEVCWKVLQAGRDCRCDFCPVRSLEQGLVPGGTYQWEEINPVTGRTYQNYDSLVKWIDGSIVHLQQSIDITELKSAHLDELTDLMNRRLGKQTLQKSISRAKEEGRVLSVCLYDLNLLKDVNDLYGHAEGDYMIQTAVKAVKELYTGEDYGFRLSGDEFVSVLFCDKEAAYARMEQALSRLRCRPKDPKHPYQIGFCYGIVEVRPDELVRFSDVLDLADQRMYEQKRRFHILKNEELDLPLTCNAGDSFEYDSEHLYDALTESTEDYIYICNMKTGVFRYPKAMVEEFGLPGEIVENAAALFSEKVHPDDRQAFLESNQEISDGRTTSHCVEYRARNRKGEWVWLRCRGHLSLDRNREPSLFAGIITNLGKRNKIDHMTGLFNKFEFEDSVRLQMESRPEQPFAVMFLGIDDLRHINDLYDRTFGDEVIRITSQKLQTAMPPIATVYRLDGDEFAILARGANLKDMRKLYSTLHQRFQHQQEYEGKKYYCTLSAGCAFYPKDAADYLDLVKFADYSLEYAKAHGKKRCIYFSQEILQERTRTLELMELLRESVEDGFRGFELHYQPQVSAQTGEVFGAEALARWSCPKYGDISPLEFIPLLEQSGLIVPVGKWALRTAVQTCKRWTDICPDFVISVNLSYRQLDEARFIPFINEVLEQERLSPRNLVVEMTESYFAKEDATPQNIFHEIRGIGVQIAMDDFGTGYSALGILKNAPADIVKIDKTFIQDIHHSNFDATFIRFVVALCHDVGIRVCLEGVETDEEYNDVSKMGLDYIQGFLFGQPQTAEQFEKNFLHRS